MSTRILLTGATGTVGREVLSRLCERQGNYAVTVFDKKTKYSKKILKKYARCCRIIFGDISVISDIREACAGQDAVIHLAAIIPPLADSNPELAEKVNIRGTENIINCTGELSPDAFFIYSSSISVYGDRNKDPWIRTDDPLQPSDRDEYARTKIEAEKLVMNSGLKWTIFRLTAIMGVNNHKPSSLMFHMPLNTPMEIATPRNTGDAFVKALDHLDKLKGKVFNLSGGEQCRIIYKDFLHKSFEIFGLGTPDFRENSFARRNFHCGYYIDGDLLDDIIDFRRDSMDDYFSMLKESVNPFRRRLTYLFRNTIKAKIQKQSEPLAAILSNNRADIEHYF